MIINGKDYQDIFRLALDIYQASDYFARELRKDTLLSFIREKDAEKYEKLVHLSLLSLPDDVFAFKASFLLNPFMSFRIKGFCFKNYKELGETMLSFSPNPNPVLTELLRYFLLSQHMKETYYSESHPKEYQMVLALEKTAEKDVYYAYYCLGYYLSGKKTILYDGKEYQDLFDLTYFLCKKEKDLDTLGSYLAKSPLLRAYAKYGKRGQQTEEYLHIVDALEKSERKLDAFLSRKKEREGN